MSGIVKIHGMKDVRKTLTSVMPKEAINIARRSVVSMAKEVRDDIRGGAPKGEGSSRKDNLKKSIRSRRAKGAKDAAFADVFIHKDFTAKRYWHFVEFGTVKTAAKAFITPVVEAWRQKAAKVYADKWWGEYRKEMVKRARKQAGLK